LWVWSNFYDWPGKEFNLNHNYRFDFDIVESNQAVFKSKELFLRQDWQLTSEARGFRLD